MHQYCDRHQCQKCEKQVRSYGYDDMKYCVDHGHICGFYDDDDEWGGGCCEELSEDCYCKEHSCLKNGCDRQKIHEYYNACAVHERVCLFEDCKEEREWNKLFCIDH